MANRDRPVNALGSRVSLSRDGTMILTDVDGTIAWESNTNSTPTGAERAELLNSGNLVLKDPQGKIMWQSFEFPTDTLLPNEPCTKSMKEGNLRLHSLNSTGSWVITWRALIRQCRVHAICGRNGIFCLYTPEPKCACPAGYEVFNTSNWNKGWKPKFSWDVLSPSNGNS
ncbi:hypothetical protein CerSpe_181940 [Prunus speciosa]